jgi:hypothetical protein
MSTQSHLVGRGVERNKLKIPGEYHVYSGFYMGMQHTLGVLIEFIASCCPRNRSSDLYCDKRVKYIHSYSSALLE